MNRRGIHRWRMPRSLYVGLSMLGGLVPWVMALLIDFPQIPVPRSELLLALLGAVYLAVLTYPLGFLGSLCFVALFWSGAATPTECLLISAPVFAALGYFQWYGWLPRAFAAPPETPVGR